MVINMIFNINMKMQTSRHQDAIYPGQVWLDTKGQRIQAHGGSVLYENGFYYWYGEDKTYTRKKGKLWTWSVRCYRSADLMNWEDLGHIIEAEPRDKKSLFHPDRRLDRPHILKNEATGQYVLWLKYSDKSHFAVLTAESLLGPYTLVEPFLQPYGRKAGDFRLKNAESNNFLRRNESRKPNIKKGGKIQP